MLRDRLLATRYAHEDGFRWRGREVSRIEGLSDAVFGFAITLLVVSLDVPKTAAEVMGAMRGVGAFAVTFAILYRLWATQYRYFRRYGLEDATTRGLNAVLLFFVLIYIYPLKFLARGISAYVVAGGVAALRPGPLFRALLDPSVRELVFLYFFGSAAVFATFALLYLHAWRHRGTLALDTTEEALTRAEWQRLGAVALGTAVLPFALARMADGAPNAGLAIELVALTPMFLAFRRTRQMRAARRAAVLQPASPPGVLSPP